MYLSWKISQSAGKYFPSFYVHIKTLKRLNQTSEWQEWTVFTVLYPFKSSLKNNRRFVDNESNF